MTIDNPSSHHDCCSDDHSHGEPQAAAAVAQETPQEHMMEKAIQGIDNLGMIASAICLVHCMAMPFVIAFLPFLGLQFLEGHESHVWLAGIIWVFALLAIVPGYLKHRKSSILFGMALGLAFVSLAVLGADKLIGEKGELICITTGNLILVAVHWKNRGLCKCCH